MPAGATRVRSNAQTLSEPLKFHANTLSPTTNFTICPPSTLTYLLFGLITIVRVAADGGAGSPRRSMRFSAAVEDKPAMHNISEQIIGKSNLCFMAIFNYKKTV